MPLQCNIDAKGKLVRMVQGIALLAIGAVLIFVWAMPAGTIAAWAVSVLCLLVGAFCIFESRKGWCVIRAMGWKTPI